jgi:hypothetical protein
MVEHEAARIRGSDLDRPDVSDSCGVPEWEFNCAKYLSGLV